MTTDTTDRDQQAREFIARWRSSSAAERANFQSFLNELCDLLDVPRPPPVSDDPSTGHYRFERPVTFSHEDGRETPNFIDLYRRGCFVLEAKQAAERAPKGVPLSSRHAEQRRSGGVTRGTQGWDTLMRRARNQAERYVRSLPADEGRPPFIVVLDVGHAIELFSEFSCTGGQYIPYPDPNSHRIMLDELERAETRETLRLLWLDPFDLDPSVRSAAVTNDIAQRLARLARSLEQAGHRAEQVAGFLMRCLFTMFAEDVGLLPRNGFHDLLVSLRESPNRFAPMVQSLWQDMKHGGFSPILREEVLHFNGRFFDDTEGLTLNADQLELLIEAARADWSAVEPAIFGTLLERALDPRERHKLGAHYTPRAYVERLVMPTIIEPLREEWLGVEVAAEQYREAGDEDKAIAAIGGFHDRLCHVRVLDPACGSGNFLYVTLEHLKRLEGEVLGALRDFGQSGKLDLASVSPQQLLGIEVNPRAAAIAELVLWIGYLQWHFRTRGNITPSLPVIKSYGNIECRDAVLDYDDVHLVLNEDGSPVMHWDGRTTKPHPVTGKEVPDETALVPTYEYINPRPATWPDADFVVGNPPFIGNWRMREALGDGYVEALRTQYPALPETCDYVMFWWHKAALLARARSVQRFGLITTNSLRQAFNRKVLQPHLQGKDSLRLVFAIPDHPWVDTADGADVRISMTVADNTDHPGYLWRVIGELKTASGERDVTFARDYGLIHANLKVGANVSSAKPLRANSDISCPGVKLHGSGFILDIDTAKALTAPHDLERHPVIKSYRNGRDLTQTPRGVFVIDLFGLSAEDVRNSYPAIYQHVLENVKPERDQNRSDWIRENWWLHGRPRPDLRDQLIELGRYITTVETAKHRLFQFLDITILPDNMLINIALDDAYFLGVLSSSLHVFWALAAGGRLGIGNDPRYNKTVCFETFPFPDSTEEQKTIIRSLAEQIDAHRKRRQALHEGLTLTGMYNVLEKLKSGEALTAKERTINEQGLCEVLLELHRELDAAVLDAYGWPDDLGEEDILERLVALNAERAAEEARGVVRWLRPEYQAPEGTVPAGQVLPEQPAQAAPTAGERLAWPGDLPARARAVQQALRGLPGPGGAADVSAQFKGGRNRESQVAEILDTLAALGQVRPVEGDRYAVN